MGTVTAQEVFEIKLFEEEARTHLELGHTSGYFVLSTLGDGLHFRELGKTPSFLVARCLSSQFCIHSNNGTKKHQVFRSSFQVALATWRGF